MSSQVTEGSSGGADTHKLPVIPETGPRRRQPAHHECVPTAQTPPFPQAAPDWSSAKSLANVDDITEGGAAGGLSAALSDSDGRLYRHERCLEWESHLQTNSESGWSEEETRRPFSTRTGGTGSSSNRADAPVSPDREAGHMTGRVQHIEQLLSSRPPEDGRDKTSTDSRKCETPREVKRIQYRKTEGMRFTIEAKSLIISVSNGALTRPREQPVAPGDLTVLEQTEGGPERERTWSIPATALIRDDSDFIHKKATSEQSPIFRRSTGQITTSCLQASSALHNIAVREQHVKRDTSQQHANSAPPRAFYPRKGCRRVRQTSPAPPRRKTSQSAASCRRPRKKRDVWTSYDCKRCGKTLYVRRRREPSCSGESERPALGRLSQRDHLCLLCLKRRGAPNSSAREAHVCSACGKHFVQQAVLDLHLQSHMEDKRFACAVCGRRFVQQSLLLIHERTHLSREPHLCPACGQTFYVKETFAAHQRSHREKKPHGCADCGKCFADKTSLQIHGRTHTGEKPFHCSDCGKSFTQHSTLVSHLRTHTGEKPFRCRECGRQFCDRSAYASHRRTHTGEKPFRCEECGKRFAQSSNLRRHERIHTGAKPYACSICGKTFIENSKLKAHLSAHLKEPV